MRFSPGTRLGPFELLGPLGAGGMGEVYRARDPRLNREVAVKVLPEDLLEGEERRKRFEREAKLLAALNHPNIAAVYSFEEIPGSTPSSLCPVLVMELHEGETLDQPLAREELTPRKAVELAVQIIQGLAAAHEKGIVHRDLKPQNLFVTKDGRIKILDFGLAKLLEPESPGSDVDTLTAKNEVVGTTGYMSPEHLKGQAVDHRADIFAFGAVLYEMLSRRRAFQKQTRAETQAAILGEDPPDLPAGIPTGLNRIVRRCLEKRPEERFQSARDLGFALEALSGSGDSAPRPPGAEPERTRRASRRRIGALLGITAILAGLVWSGSYIFRARRSWENLLLGARFTRLTDWEGSELDAAISSDGKFVTFLSDRDGFFDVWANQVGSGEFLNLTRGQFPNLLVERVRNLGFSGDGAHIWLEVPGKDPAGAVRETSVWLVPLMGGTPRAFLAKAACAVWSPDGNRVVYFNSTPGDPTFVADRIGGNPKQILVEKPGIHNHFPAWSVDGRTIYLVRGIPGTYDMDVWRVPAGGGEAERVTSHHSRVGHPTPLDERTLIYTLTSEEGSGLYVVDVERKEPHRVTTGLDEYISVAASGDRRRLVATVATPTRNLWTVPISDHVSGESEVRRFGLPAVRGGAPRFGPDYLLYLSSAGALDSLWKLKDGQASELWRATDGAVVAAPAISPDGTQIAFPVRDERGSRLHVIASDGTGARVVGEGLDVQDAPSFSPDGAWIAVCARNQGQAQPLFKVPAAGGPPVRLVDGVVYTPVWSPDGRIIVYSESRMGPSYQVKAVTADGRPFDLPEMRVGYNGNPYRFLPDGKSLVVLQGTVRHQNFWLVDLETRKRRPLTDLRPGFDVKGFDVSRDGRQILFDRFRENADVVLIDLPRR